MFGPAVVDSTMLAPLSRTTSASSAMIELRNCVLSCLAVDGWSTPSTLQIGEPSVIARATGATDGTVWAVCRDAEAARGRAETGRQSAT